MSQFRQPFLAGRHRPARRTILLAVIALSALTSYVVIGWLKVARFPSVQQLAMDLNIAVAESNETVFLKRAVVEHRMIATDGDRNEPAYSLYTNERDEVVGFAGMQVFPTAGRAAPANAAIDAFLHHLFPTLKAPAFSPAAIRTPETPPQQIARNVLAVATGFHVWIQDYAEYQPDEQGAEQIVRTRRYWVITAPDWEIPRDISAR